LFRPAGALLLIADFAFALARQTPPLVGALLDKLNSSFCSEPMARLNAPVEIRVTAMSCRTKPLDCHAMPEERMSPPPLLPRNTASL
jgi:hypothetical protein